MTYNQLLVLGWLLIVLLLYVFSKCFFNFLFAGKSSQNFLGYHISCWCSRMELHFCLRIKKLSTYISYQSKMLYVLVSIKGKLIAF